MGKYSHNQNRYNFVGIKRYMTDISSFACSCTKLPEQFNNENVFLIKRLGQLILRKKNRDFGHENSKEIEFSRSFVQNQQCLSLEFLTGFQKIIRARFQPKFKCRKDRDRPSHNRSENWAHYELGLQTEENQEKNILFQRN